MAKVYQLQGLQYRQQNHFNQRGQVTAQTYPSGMAVNYGYDGVGRVSNVTHQSTGDEITAIIDNVSYLPFAGTKRIKYANGIYQHNNHDIDGRLESIGLNKGFNSLHNREYVYDGANQITDIINHTNTELSQHYSYDVLSRLTGATGEYGELAYGYDEVGNRLSRRWQLANGQVQLDESYQYAQTSNQLNVVQDEGATRQLTYNDNGNTEFDSKQGKTLTYNAANRLTHITFADKSKADYVYNAKGQRVVKTVTDANGKMNTTHYHFNQQDLLIAETRDDGQALVEYVYLNKQRVASIRYKEAEPVIDYVHNDHLGSPMLQTNYEGELIWRNQALPFGQEYQTSTVEQSFGFPGQYQDIESGYSYNYFRDYDSSLGRYIQSDPIGLAGGMNTYVYVMGNPVSIIDPRGLEGLMCEIAITVKYDIESNDAYGFSQSLQANPSLLRSERGLISGLSMDELGWGGAAFKVDSTGFILDGRVSVGWFKNDIDSFMTSNVFSIYTPIGSLHIHHNSGAANSFLGRFEGFKLGTPSPSLGTTSSFYDNEASQYQFTTSIYKR